MITAELLNKIKPGTIIINTAPLFLFDLPALKQRLPTGGLTLILDHSDELSAADAQQFSQLPGCIMYPPIGYTTKEATASKQEIFVGNMESYLQGKGRNKVN